MKINLSVTLSFITIFMNLWCSAAGSDLVQIRVGMKYGVIDKNGNVILSPRYSLVNISREGQIKATLDNKIWATVNSKGQVESPHGAVKLDEFREGLGLVRSGSKYGYINIEGKEVVPPQFSSARPFSDGVAAVVPKGDKWSYVDIRGRPVIKPQFTSAESFKDNIARVTYKPFGAVQELKAIIDMKKTCVWAEEAPKTKSIAKSGDAKGSALDNTWRTWTLKTGSKATAILLEASLDEVIFGLKNGRKSKISMGQLAAADRQYVRQRMKEAGIPLFVPKPGDRDGDRIPDRLDREPNIPNEDFDPYADPMENVDSLGYVLPTTSTKAGQ